MLFYSVVKWLHLFLELVKVCAHITMEKDFRKILNQLARFKLTDAGWAEGDTELYDLQTKYGTNDQVQKRWKNWINTLFGRERSPESKL